MDARSRRSIEMGERALKFSGEHPDTDPGYVVAEGRLKELMPRANALAVAQRTGLVDVHAAAGRKSELRRAIRALPIAHLAQVGRQAAREEHEMGKTFTFKPGGSTFLAFRTAAGTMLTAAQSHTELLVKHGLSQSVLEEFGQMLGQFDEAVTLGNDGRTAHKGASRELRQVATEIVRTVRVMDARNRQRFQADGQLLGSWISASTVLGAPRNGPVVTTPKDTVTSPQDSPPNHTTAPAPTAGDVRPAA
ncbi:MAG: hypothetical protein ABI766_13295 [Gemmatimonadales bacterium]